jgi:hypothetical protein
LDVVSAVEPAPVLQSLEVRKQRKLSLDRGPFGIKGISLLKYSEENFLNDVLRIRSSPQYSMRYDEGQFTVTVKNH